MRPQFLALALLGTALLAGCGGSDDVTDPSKLPPLSAADLEEIKQRDAQIEAEERGTPVVKKSTKGAKVAGRGVARNPS